MINIREFIRVKRIIFFILILSAIYTFLHLFDLDDRLFRAAISLKHMEKTDKPVIFLNDYILAKTQSIACVEHNLSGITYNYQTKTFFVVINNPPMVHNIDREGRCLREIVLKGFNDTEGIVHLDGSRFAIIEEGENRINIIEINNSDIIDRKDVISSLQIELKEHGNRGFEGIAYDRVKQRIYLVMEKKPKQLIAIDGLVKKRKNINMKIDPNLLPRYLFLDDLSGLHFDSRSRHLLLLSHDSNAVAERSLDGEVISYLEFGKGYLGLIGDELKCEGITMDDDENIYIVGEPNLFYQYIKEEMKK